MLKVYSEYLSPSVRRRTYGLKCPRAMGPSSKAVHRLAYPYKCHAYRMQPHPDHNVRPCAI